MDSRKSAKDLVLLIANGHRELEDEFVNRFRRGVLFILERQTKRRDVIDDLFQETFRIAIEKIRKNQIREPEKVGGFLASTARFVAIEFFRRESLNIKRQVPLNEINSSQKGTLAILEEKEIASLVGSVIDSLKSNRDRELLHRFYIMQEEKADICRLLDLDAAHFTRVLYRAKRRFRSQYVKLARKRGISIS